jgi:hypothetical protein
LVPLPHLVRDRDRLNEYDDLKEEVRELHTRLQGLVARAEASGAPLALRDDAKRCAEKLENWLL